MHGEQDEAQRADTATGGSLARSPPRALAERRHERLKARPNSPWRYRGFDWRSIFPAFGRMLEEERRFAHGFLWLPVWMGFGAAAEFAAHHDIALLAIAMPLVVCGALAVVARRAGRREAPPLIAVAAFLCGMLAAFVQIERAATIMIDGEVVTHVTGVVTARDGDGAGKWRYTVRLTSTDRPVISRPPKTVRLLARGRKAKPIAVGDGIEGLARLSPPSGPALPGEYDFAFNNFFQGIGAIGFFYGPPSRDPDAAPKSVGLATRIGWWVADLREGINRRIRRVLPGPEGAVAAALIVSQRRAIPENVVDALRAAGLAHMLSISGLHMVLVVGTFFVTVRRLFGLVPGMAERFALKKVAALGGLLLSTAYLVLSGAEVATVRSWIMIAIVLTAVLVDRPALTLRNVAVAALAIIAVNPAAVVGPSFQMSFAATAALIAAYSAFRKRPADRGHGLQQRKRPFVELRKLVIGIAFTSLIGGLSTDIFAAYHFHRLATYGVLGNLLAMPVVSVVVMPMALLAALLMPYGLEALPLKVMGVGLDFVIWAAERVEALGGTVTTGRLTRVELILFLVGFLLLVLLRTRLRLTGVVPIVLGFVLFGWPLSPPPAIMIAPEAAFVGIRTPDGIATNTARPSSFYFHQWQDALRQSGSVDPEEVVVTKAAQKAIEMNDGAARRKRHAILAAALDRRRDGVFVCVAKEWCAARLKSGLTVVTLEDLAYLGPACDLAAVVVTDKPIRLAKCRSGALLLTGRTLRRTGALEIYARPLRLAQSSASAARPPPADRTPPRESLPTKRRLRLTVVSALDDVVRPWTVQRYYDWRSRSFDFDAADDHVRNLVVSAD